MKRMLSGGLLLTLFAAQSVLACSIGPGSRDFVPIGNQSPEARVMPTAPSVLSVRVFRGNNEDRNSCASFGALIIEFEDAEGIYDLGFYFELHSGTFPLNSLPNKVISPVRDDDSGNLRFEFYWLDYKGNGGEQMVGDIHATIVFHTVSHTLAEGKRVYIEIKSP